MTGQQVIAMLAGSHVI